MEKTQIKISTLSPVCIGNGQKLSPIVDYLFDANKKKIHYLNKAKIEEILGKNDALMDKYIQGIVYGMDNNKTNFNLKDFLQNQLRLTPKDYILYSVDARISSATVLSAIIRNANDRKPYIPASSLKGAIKTALLYDWLTKEGNNWCKNYLNNLNNKLKIKELEQELEKEFNTYEISLHDTKSFPTKGKVIENKRLHLKKGEETIPSIWECIAENEESHTQIWKARKKIGENQYQDFSWENLCQKINRYSLHQSSMELDLLEDWEDNINTKTYDNLYNFCQDLYEEIDNATDTAYLRIGNGKGYFFNSVGVALYDADDEYKRKFLQLLKSKDYRKVSNAHNFPITRVLEFTEKQPLGWVKLELIK